MLKELKINNLAVVEDVTIQFSRGLNVLTGLHQERGGQAQHRRGV